MSTYWSLEEHEGLDWLADTLAILMIGIGICALAWTKSWMNRPSFNTGELFLVWSQQGVSDYRYSLQYDIYHFVYRVCSSSEINP